MDHIAGFGNKMAEIIKFLKIMILFIFLFLIVTGVSESMTPCKVDSDCPLDLCQRPDVAKCLFYTCFCQNENMI
ncbi:unnamed protein product [Lathyrus oleraceus]